MSLMVSCKPPSSLFALCVCVCGRIRRSCRTLHVAGSIPACPANDGGRKRRGGITRHILVFILRLRRVNTDEFWTCAHGKARGCRGASS